MNFGRRQFLYGAGAFGALTVFDGCTVGAASGGMRPLKVSPIRGGGADSVLKVSEVELAVGVRTPFKVLHVSDTHLNFWDVTDFCGNAEAEAHFERRWVRFPQALNSFHASLDYAQKKGIPVFHTGDLVDWNTVANVDLLRRDLKGVDFFYALGNHEYHSSRSRGESKPLSPDGIRARMQTVIGNDLTAASRILNGVNFVAFDNGETNLRPETIAAVEREFDKGLPVVLLCHIPPIYTEKFLDNSLEAGRAILRGQGLVAEAEAKTRGKFRTYEERYDAPTAAFWRRLERRKELKAILCGHTHVEERDRFSETADMFVAGGNYEGFATEFTFS